MFLSDSVQYDQFHMYWVSWYLSLSFITQTHVPIVLILQAFDTHQILASRLFIHTSINIQNVTTWVGAYVTGHGTSIPTMHRNTWMCNTWVTNPVHNSLFLVPCNKEHHMNINVYCVQESNPSPPGNTTFIHPCNYFLYFFILLLCTLLLHEHLKDSQVFWQLWELT